MTDQQSSCPDVKASAQTSSGDTTALASTQAGTSQSHEGSVQVTETNKSEGSTSGNSHHQTFNDRMKELRQAALRDHHLDSDVVIATQPSQERLSRLVGQ
uniref:Uncharacterized protein n=1 Tax=Kwoniella bestiolae CBS 10118 TaxID=1296100 RepID=A0A1B9GGY8_9TREE|nr:hypothetical protein I302_01746 [Kwoniella bestiolae CBS 10118]OCF30227.1 hypothetical protein I302_01746 [Kwoniella bestiolae CBS 10118]